MARPLSTDKKDAAYAQALLARAKNKDEMRMAQAVLLPYRQSMTLTQAAVSCPLNCGQEGQSQNTKE